MFQVKNQITVILLADKMHKPISTDSIQVGSAVKKELFDDIKNSLDFFNTSINSLQTQKSKIEVMKFYVLNASSFSTATGLHIYQSTDTFTITNAFVQIFEKGSLAGFFEIDVKKSTTDMALSSFSSIFSTRPRIDFSSASDYQKSTNQVFDPGRIEVVPGDYLRLDITQTPTSGVMGKFLVTVYGE